jgi:hypothetical protein
VQDDQADSALLSCTTQDQLRVHLHNILAASDRSLTAIQRRIQKAFVVFGEDVVCSRLHATLVGGNQKHTEATPEAAKGRWTQCTLDHWVSEGGVIEG